MLYNIWITLVNNNEESRLWTHLVRKIVIENNTIAITCGNTIYIYAFDYIKKFKIEKEE
jgi:hypothetical protein